MKDYCLLELEQLDRILEAFGNRAQCEVLATIPYKTRRFPIPCIRLGSPDPEAPTLAFFGGVHGLEKIGSEVILSYLQTISRLLDWDEEYCARLERSRLIFVPVVNPVGVYAGTRANGNGVDLMRNAPIEAEGDTRFYSGHRVSARLPWFRGNPDAMETEALALCRAVETYLFKARLSIAVDLHSGFGIDDRLWFPYASRKKPFGRLAEVVALKDNFDRCYPHHIYKIEPTCSEYLIHGDLWDYLFDRFAAQAPQDRLFLPLTLEMGSWLWLRKNPRHLFMRHGLFHPILPHRQQRIYRRHFLLFDFLHRSLLYPGPWTGLDDAQRALNTQKGMEMWYA